METCDLADVPTVLGRHGDTGDRLDTKRNPIA
jgi:hypothetical protein